MTLEREFIELCGDGLLNKAKEFLKNNPDIDICDDGDCAFRWAIMDGHIETCMWLLEVEPKINIRTHKDYPFQLAANGGHTEICKWLLKVEPKIDIHSDTDLAIKWAARFKHVETLEYLFELGGYDLDILETDEVKPYKDHLIRFKNRNRDRQKSARKIAKK